MRGSVPIVIPYIDVERKLDLWNEFALKNNSSCKVKRNVDKTFNRLIIDISFNNYVINFEESDTNYLRVKCQLGSVDFTFYLTFEDLIEKIIKRFNNREIEIGDKEFDDKYLIVTNDEKKMRGVLSDKKLRNLLIKNNVSNFHLDHGELFIIGHRQTDTIDELNDLLEIIKNIIKRICP